MFVEAEATPRSPYVQQEVRLTVKLYYALNLTDGNLDDPKADGLVVRKLGQDSNYTADVDGRRYRVRRASLRAQCREERRARHCRRSCSAATRSDPGDMNSFFSRGRSMSAQSEPISARRARASGRFRQRHVAAGAIADA